MLPQGQGGELRLASPSPRVAPSSPPFGLVGPKVRAQGVLWLPGRPHLPSPPRLGLLWWESEDVQPG